MDKLEEATGESEIEEEEEEDDDKVETLPEREVVDTGDEEEGKDGNDDVDIAAVVTVGTVNANGKGSEVLQFNQCVSHTVITKKSKHLQPTSIHNNSQ